MNPLSSKTVNSKRFPKTNAVAIVTILAATLLSMSWALADTINQDFKIEASDGMRSAQFGHSVAISGEYICVGAQFHDGIADEAGAAYVYNSSTGEELYSLTSDSTFDFDLFGSAVDIENGFLAVGAPTAYNHSGKGEVYIFNIETGVQIRKIIASDASYSPGFGTSLDMDDGFMVVGDPLDYEDPYATAGSAYVINYETGAEIHRLIADDYRNMDYFGSSVAMDDGVIVVGATGDDDNGSQSGSAYLFDAATGEQLFKLIADDGYNWEYFGFSVAIENGIVAVGAPYHMADRGGVYLFDVSTGEQITKIMATTPGADDLFGRTVEIDDGNLAIGAVGYGENSTETGLVYLFDLATGEELHHFSVPGIYESAGLGSSVSLDNGKMVTGAYRDSDGGWEEEFGSAYIFSYGSGGTSAVPVAQAGLSLSPNFPNPFNPSTTITYSLEKDAMVELSIYSARGQRVRTLYNGWQTSAETHSVAWDGKDANGRIQASGVYYSRLRSNGQAVRRKMVLLK